MTYRAPVNEMLFTMRHLGELERAVDEGIYPDLSLDVVEPFGASGNGTAPPVDWREHFSGEARGFLQ